MTSDAWGLDGKRVLVTGGASGIGAATARLAAADGASVLIADIDSSAGADLAADIGGHFVALDVSSAASWSSAIDGMDPVDVAVLNAGVEFRDPKDFATVDDPGSWDLDRYQRTVGVNIDGVALGVRALVPGMSANGGGAISATASLAGLIPWSPDPIYSMTKWAVVGLTRALAPPLKARRITINCVCPGAVATPMTRITDGSVPAHMADPAHIGRAHLTMATSGDSGRAVKAVVGRDPAVHRFAQVEDID